LTTKTKDFQILQDKHWYFIEHRPCSTVAFMLKTSKGKILSPEMCSSRIQIQTSLLDQKLQNHPWDGCESYNIIQMLCCLLSEDEVNLHFHLILHISFCNIHKMNPPPGHLGRLVSFELGQQYLFQASLAPWENWKHHLVHHWKMHSWNSTPNSVGPQNSAVNNETLLCHPKSIKIFLPAESNKE
jgi:hypothetical protein